MTGSAVRAHGLCVDLAGRSILRDVSITVEPGQVLGVVGPNGCGKSTLLRTLLRLVRPTAGSVRIDGIDIAALSAKRLARMTAAVLQDTTGDFDLSVGEVVAMGRAPHKRMFQRDEPADLDVVTESLALVDCAHLIGRSFTVLSGGERQRVLVARALAQQPRLLVMDEPTNHLDVRHQLEVLALPGRLGITAVVSLHDLTLAAHYCDVITVLHNGAQVDSGDPESVLTTEMMERVYDVKAVVHPHVVTGRPQVSYTPSTAPGQTLTETLKISRVSAPKAP
ncbi:ABC transporter ATP-binding protein [Mycolicibacterium sp.]|uniref:ABC transporter ATP-binding protein n=1 Tax=Mycolicibacterium sp. TaxID=2320850 RepID=UPI003D13D86A